MISSPSLISVSPGCRGGVKWMRLDNVSLSTEYRISFKAFLNERRWVKYASIRPSNSRNDTQGRVISRASCAEAMTDRTASTTSGYGPCSRPRASKYFTNKSRMPAKGATVMDNHPYLHSFELDDDQKQLLIHGDPEGLQHLAQILSQL